MAYDSRVYRILIASPSDVLEEREAAVRVMQDWNDLHSNNRRVVILPLRWETHTAPEYNVRPQEAINRRIVDDCDLVVGIFWTKLGTPTGEADSGTLEEIERVAKAGKPVMLYFSHVPVDPNRVDLRQMERLKSFKEGILSNALVETYGSSLDFRDKFANQLELKIRDLQKADEVGQPLPLDLQFLSPQTAEPIGRSFSTTVDAVELTQVPTGDGELMKQVNEVLENVRTEASIALIALTIKNKGSSGIRNLYVEVSLKPLTGTFEASTSHPLIRHWGKSLTFEDFYFASVHEESEIERKLQKLSGEGLTKEDTEWKYRFEWDALQPQRARLVRPFLYLQVTSNCEAELSAKVYADSFASPVVLNGRISVNVQTKLIEADTIVARAKELLAHNASSAQAKFRATMNKTSLTGGRNDEPDLS
jgi:hypothetical protein